MIRAQQADKNTEIVIVDDGFYVRMNVARHEGNGSSTRIHSRLAPKQARAAARALWTAAREAEAHVPEDD